MRRCRFRSNSIFSVCGPVSYIARNIQPGGVGRQLLCSGARSSLNGTVANSRVFPMSFVPILFGWDEGALGKEARIVYITIRSGDVVNWVYAVPRMVIAGEWLRLWGATSMVLAVYTWQSKLCAYEVAM